MVVPGQLQSAMLLRLLEKGRVRKFFEELAN